MKLHARTAPHIRHPESSRTLMSDAIILCWRSYITGCGRY